jgi:alkylation response protein AidB-like acyl-CoA dehydrogenase
MVETDSPDLRTLSAMLKLRAGEIAVTLADAAVQIHGGAGYCRGVLAERLLRDARLAPIGEGASELLLQVIGRAVRGR